MKTKVILSVLFFYVLFAGCADKAKESEFFSLNKTKHETSEESKSSMDTYDMSSPENEKSVSTISQTEGNIPQVDIDKDVIKPKIIQNAEVGFKVENYNKSRSNILEIVKKHKAYISSENQKSDAYSTSNLVIIRVNSSEFDALIDDLLNEAVYVDYKRVNSEDVTEEFVDINARLKSKKDAMLQYEAVLKKSSTISDILYVQQYIRTLQEEIESLEGRLRYLNNKVELSTITLSFYEQGKILPSQKESFGYKLREALSWGWHGFLSFLIGVVYLWPLWMILGVSLFLVFYFIKKGRKKRAARKAQQ